MCTVSTSRSSSARGVPASRPAGRASPVRSTYHHGDLRAALLDAAELLLDEAGVAGVSLREVARRAGVTPTATYRHFADKESLLAALAARGFDAFGAALAEAAQRHGSDDALAAMAQAYLAFALQRPGRFRLMFGPAVADRARHPELQAAVERASVGFRAASAGGEPTEHAITMLRGWSLIHGLTQLVLDGMLPGQDPVQLVRAITAQKAGRFPRAR